MDKNGKRGRGRPRKEISKDQFEKLCYLQCTLIEMSYFFKCCEDTVETWCKETYGKNFSDVFKIYSSSGKISLRRSQFKAAEAGSVPMLIWLGKQYLGQKEPKEIVVSTPEGDSSLEAMHEYFRKTTVD